RTGSGGTMRRRPKQRRRARRTVLFAVGLFALSQLVLASAAESFVPELRDPAFGTRWRLLHESIAEAPNRSLVLALGSSRVETGIQPRAISDSHDRPILFNFGRVGGGPVLEWLAFRRISEAGLRPKALLIEVMPALLCDPRPVEQTIHAERLTWSDVADLLPDAADRTALIREWFAARAAPVYSSRFIILSRLLPTWLPISSRTDYLWAELDQWGAGR